VTSPVTQTDIEKRYPASAVRAAFSDDGSGSPGARLQVALDEAYDMVSMRIRKCWPSATGVEDLVTNSPALTGVVCRIAMALGTAGRPEYRADQKGPLDGEIQTALKTVDGVVAADLRPESEDDAGANPTYTERIASVEDPQYLFSPSINKPSPGGY
jgi:hypothetical protein